MTNKELAKALLKEQEYSKELENKLNLQNKTLERLIQKNKELRETIKKLSNLIGE